MDDEKKVYSINEKGYPTLSSGERAAVSWRNKGLAMHNTGKYRDAIKCYKKAIKLDPEDAISWIYKGNTHFALREPEEANNCYDKALQLDRNNSWAWLLKGNTLHELGNYDGAIRLYDEAIKLHQNDAVAWKWKGHSLFKLKRFDQAIKCYDKTLKINPTDVWPLYNKGIIFGFRDEHEKAIGYFDKALKISPSFPLLWTGKGDSLLLKGDESAAKKIYKKAINLSMKNIRSLDFDDRFSLSENLFKTGKYREAKEQLTRDLKHTDNIIQCFFIRFLAFVSHFLEIDTHRKLRSSLRDSIIVDLLEQYKLTRTSYYKKFKSTFAVSLVDWDLRSIAISISNSKASLQTKFLLLTLIDLIQGRVSQRKMSFFRMFSRKPKRKKPQIQRKIET